MPGQLPNSVERAQQLLMKLGENWRVTFTVTCPVGLSGRKTRGYVTGHSPNYIRVRAKADRDINTLVPVRITHVTSRRRGGCGIDLRGGRSTIVAQVMARRCGAQVVMWCLHIPEAVLAVLAVQAEGMRVVLATRAAAAHGRY